MKRGVHHHRGEGPAQVGATFSHRTSRIGFTPCRQPMRRSVHAGEGCAAGSSRHGGGLSATQAQAPAPPGRSYGQGAAAGGCPSDHDLRRQAERERRNDQVRRQEGEADLEGE